MHQLRTLSLDHVKFYSSVVSRFDLGGTRSLSDTSGKSRRGNELGRHHRSPARFADSRESFFWSNGETRHAITSFFGSSANHPKQHWRQRCSQFTFYRTVFTAYNTSIPRSTFSQSFLSERRLDGSEWNTSSQSTRFERQQFLQIPCRDGCFTTDPDTSFYCGL